MTQKNVPFFSVPFLNTVFCLLDKNVKGEKCRNKKDFYLFHRKIRLPLSLIILIFYMLEKSLTFFRPFLSLRKDWKNLKILKNYNKWSRLLKFWDISSLKMFFVKHLDGSIECKKKRQTFEFPVQHVNSFFFSN